MNIKSSVKQLPYPQERVFETLSNFSNLAKLKDKVPEDKIKDLEYDADSLSLNTPFGHIKLNIVEKTRPESVKLKTDVSPVPVTVNIHIEAVTPDSCKLWLELDADINPFVGGMLKKPLAEGVENVIQMLSLVNYN